jgi:hypothetical protein
MGCGREGGIIAVGIVHPARIASYESAGGWKTAMMMMCSPEWSLMGKRDLPSWQHTETAGVVYFLHLQGSAAGPSRAVKLPLHPVRRI